MELEILLKNFYKGDIRALSKLITLVENGNSNSEKILKEIFPKTGKGYRVGVTGPPGVGKSTIIDQLAPLLKNRGERVGIIAVDPSSPFSGGAFLGDRHRMPSASRSGIYIRSMATRGAMGGLSEATPYVAYLFEAFGFDTIIIETIGVGQSEWDIIKTTDTVVVVLSPESGDGIQAMKAGIMEIADIFVINKYDREGGKRFHLELESVLGSEPMKNAWKIPIIPVIATQGVGINELSEKVIEHKDYLIGSGKLVEKRKRRVFEEIEKLVKSKVWLDLIQRIDEKIREDMIDGVLKGLKDPFSVAEEILNAIS